MFLLNSCGSTNVSFEELSVEFKNPPVYSRPGAFWCWLNGNMSKEAISRDLREMSEKGMGRAEIWDVAAANNKDNYIPAGPAFLSDSSVAMIKYAFAQGKKYGIKIGMIGSSGWNAGGTWVEPEWASKQLYFSELIVEGPVKKSFEIPFPEVPRR
ncbi:glycosyl hydrolase, partial [Bacteroidota bacterium]